MNDILSIIVIVFGILQIILFFKIWGMTNNVKSINEKFEPVDSPFIKASVAYTKGDKEMAYTLLLDSFIFDVTVLANTVKDNYEWVEEFSKLELKYGSFFETIGKTTPDLDKYRDQSTYLIE